MGNMSETRKLTLHPLAIHTFIKAQAGSLGKALSESIMNAIDAFADNINITITSKGYVIEDNGQGFLTRQEIVLWFETLGWPHDEGNHRQYGKFGLGRAQAWAYASNVWHSNQFLMRVDVQHKGLDYELEEIDPRKGTRIEGTFYHELSFSELNRVEEEIRQLVKYVPAFISLNGTAISKDPATEEWDLETEDAYMRFDNQSYSLDVYNIGVLVAHFPKYRFKCSGVIVTKPERALSLNVARNDILTSECQVWRRIQPLLPEEGEKVKPEKKEKLAMFAQKAIIAQVKAGSMPMSDALTKVPYLVTSVHGRAVSHYDITRRGYRTTVLFVPKGDEFGKRISKLRMAVVLTTDTLELWEVDTPEELKALFALEFAEPTPYTEDRLRYLNESVWTLDAKGTFPALADNRMSFTTAELTRPEKAAQISYSSASKYLNGTLSKVAKELGFSDVSDSSGIKFGDSPTRLAWLDDTGHLVLRKAEAVKALEGALPKLLSHILRALREAYAEKFGEQADAVLMRLASESEALGLFGLAAVSRYVGECKNHNLPLPSRKLDELERAAAV